MRSPAPRPGRRLDAVSLLCIVVGVAGYAYSYRAMRILEGGGLVPGASSRSAFAQYYHYTDLSRGALALVVVGIVVAVVAAVLARRRGTVASTLATRPTTEHRGAWPPSPTA